jgi:adenosylcobinamide-phosphate guanylyltransferase
MIIGILMAGGCGTRLSGDVEKPLFNFNGKFLIDYVLDNFRDSIVDKIIIALSPHTPCTREYLTSNGLSEYNDRLVESFIVTPGEGYLKDYNYILGLLEKGSKNDTLVFLNTDLPFVSSKIIDDVIGVYESNSLDALSVFVPETIFKDNNIDYKYAFNDLVPSGLNIVRSENIIQEQEDLIIPLVDLALNINTPNNVSVATDYLKKS